MLVACRLAGLSALEAYYAGVDRARNGGRSSPMKGPAPCCYRGAGQSAERRGPKGVT